MPYAISSPPAARRPWGGLAPFVDLHREMNRMFDDLFFNGGAWFASPLTLAQNAATPLLDVQDREDEVCIHADMPGIAPADLELRLEGDTLTLSGERRLRRDDGAGGGSAESVSRVQRAVRLPFEPEPDRVHAEFENGVVTVHVPREARVERSRRIEVEVRPVADGQRASAAGPQAAGESAGSRPEGESTGPSRGAPGSSPAGRPAPAPRADAEGATAR